MPNDLESEENTGFPAGESGGNARRIAGLLLESLRDGASELWGRVLRLVQSPDGISRGLKIIVAGSLGISFLLVLLLLVFYRPSQTNGTAAGASGSAVSKGQMAADIAGAAPAAASPAGSPGGTVLSWISTPIDPDQYLIPGRRGFGTGIQWRFSRIPRQTWSEKEVSRFWIDPKKLVVDHLSKRNDSLIDSVLNGVP